MNQPQRQGEIVPISQVGNSRIVHINGQNYLIQELPTPLNPVPIHPYPPITPQEKPDPWLSPTWPFILFGSVVAGGVVLIGAVGFFLPRPTPIVVPAQQTDQTVVLEMLRQQNATLQGQLGQMQGQNQQLQQQLQAQPKFERRCQSSGFLGLGQDCTEVQR